MGRARSLAELQFVLELTPCVACGARLWRDFSAVGATRRGRREVHAEISCAGCGARRQLQAWADGDLTQGPLRRFHLGGDEPSKLLDPAGLRAALEALEHQRSLPCTELAPEAWFAQGHAVERALTCLHELQKFGVDTTTERGPWLALDQERQADAARVWALQATPRLANHALWHRSRGDSGEPLVLESVKIQDLNLSGADLSGGSFREVDFRSPRLHAINFGGATLEGCTFTSAALTRAGFEAATLTACHFEGADLGLARFQGARLRGCTFDAADLARSSWSGAALVDVHFVGAHFDDAALDGAHFLSCDLTGAQLAPPAPVPMGTSRGVIFEGCQLAATHWQGRDLRGAIFRGCTAPGATGAPRATDEGIELAALLTGDGPGRE